MKIFFEILALLIAISAILFATDTALPFSKNISAKYYQVDDQGLPSKNICKDCSGATLIDFGQIVQFHNEVPFGQNHANVASCEISRFVGRVRAINSDAFNGRPNQGSWVFQGCSKALSRSYVVECCIVSEDGN